MQVNNSEDSASSPDLPSETEASPEPDSTGAGLVRVERTHSDFAVSGVAAFTAFACGSVLGVPWELQTPPSDDDPLEMSGREPDFAPAEWGADMHLAVCVAEVGVVGPLDVAASLDVLATRIIAWYESNPAQVPLEVQSVVQWTLDPSLAPAHLRAELIAAGCGAKFVRGKVAGEESAGGPTTGRKATGGKSPGTAMRAVARARHQNRRFSARVPGNELLPLMVPVALANVADSESCSRAALAVTSLLSASPQVALLDLAYAELLRHTLEAAAKGVNWRDSIDWDRAVDTSVQMAGDALAGWTVVDGEPPIFGEEGPLPEDEKVLRSIRDPRESGESSDAGFSAGTGAGLDAVSALDRVLAAVDATRWELQRNPSLNPVRVGVESAVRSGGDTDTVAALVGALLGAACGPTAVPSDWVESIWGWPGLRQDGLRDLATGCVYAGLAPKQLT